MNLNDRQGGKVFGQIKNKQASELDGYNREILDDDIYKDVEDLGAKLEAYKHKFMEFDLDASGDIDIMELKQMLEKLGQAKTHLELQKMIKEVDKTNSGTINYNEFIDMMLGSRSSVLKLILLFEEKMKGDQNKPKGPPPRKSIDMLP